MNDSHVMFTKYKSTSGAFSSAYTINNNDDEIIEILSANVVSPQFFKGTAERISIPFDNFLDVLKNMESDEALGYGLHLSKYGEAVDIVAKDEEDLEDGKLSFSKANFKYRKRPGILLIDCYYPRTTALKPPLTPQSLIEILIKIDSQFEKAAYVFSESISKSVYIVGEDTETNKAYRFYFPVSDATDIPRYGKLLFDRLWLQGCGYIKLSPSGKMLVRSPINATVYSPDYFDIVGTPINDKNIKYKKPIPTFSPGNYLDTTRLADLTTEEQDKLYLLIKDKKMEKESVSATKKAKWGAKKFGDHKITQDSLDTILNNNRKELLNSFMLEFTTETISVKNVLYSYYDKDDEFHACEQYHGQALADPFEGSNNDKITARFWSKDCIPFIDSFVHGEHITYHFNTFHTDEKSWQLILNENVIKFNKDHFNVMVNGRNRIMRREPGSGISEGRIIYSFFARGELSAVYDNDTIVTEKNDKKEIKKNILMAWVTHPKANTYRGGVVFLPNKEPKKGYFNTWLGFGMKPRPAPNPTFLSSIYKHIKEVVCSGNADLYDYFIRWIAYTMQNPDKQAGVAIVLRGEKGTGKSIVGHFLRKIWGNHGLHIINPKHLVGNFNAHLADTCFLFADEAFYAGDKSTENLLKGLVTEPMLLIERKGVDAIQQPNYLKILMVTNSEYVVPVSRDERRYCVIDVASTHREKNAETRKYFTNLARDLDDKRAQSAFLYEMLNFDLKKPEQWDIRNIPDSIGLRDQRYFSMNSVQHWFADALNMKTFNTLGTGEFGTYWFRKITTAQLYKSYTEWFSHAKRSEYTYVPECVMSEYLGKIFQKVKKVPGTNNRGFNFVSVEIAREMFEAYEKIKLSELSSFEEDEE